MGTSNNIHSSVATSKNIHSNVATSNNIHSNGPNSNNFHKSVATTVVIAFIKVWQLVITFIPNVATGNNIH